MSQTGWIKLHRQIKDNKIWKSKEPFDKRSAWIDLLIRANHRDKEMEYHGKTIMIERGCFVVSIRTLADYWRWEKGQVESFLRTLEKDDMLSKKKIEGCTVMIIVNYEYFQGSDEDENDEFDSKIVDSNVDSNVDSDVDSNIDSESLENTCVEGGGVDSDIDTNIDSSVDTNVDYPKKYKNIIILDDKSSNRPTEPDDNKKQSNYEIIKNKWNELSEYGIAPIKVLDASGDTKRTKAVRARLRQVGLETFLEAIDKIKVSDFLQGKRTDFIITFDWFVKPSNFPKVLEGAYDNRESSYSQSSYSFRRFANDQ